MKFYYDKHNHHVSPVYFICDGFYVDYVNKNMDDVRKPTALNDILQVILNDIISIHGDDNINDATLYETDTLHILINQINSDTNAEFLLWISQDYITFNDLETEDTLFRIPIHDYSKELYKERFDKSTNI